MLDGNVAVAGNSMKNVSTPAVCTAFDAVVIAKVYDAIVFAVVGSGDTLTLLSAVEVVTVKYGELTGFASVVVYT